MTGAAPEAPPLTPDPQPIPVRGARPLPAARQPAAAGRTGAPTTRGSPRSQDSGPPRSGPPVTVLVARGGRRSRRPCVIRRRGRRRPLDGVERGARAARWRLATQPFSVRSRVTKTGPPSRSTTAAGQQRHKLVDAVVGERLVKILGLAYEPVSHHEGAVDEVGVGLVVHGHRRRGHLQAAELDLPDEALHEGRRPRRR